MSWRRWFGAKPSAPLAEPAASEAFEEPGAQPRRSFYAGLSAPPGAGFSEAPVRGLTDLEPGPSSQPVRPVRPDVDLLAEVLATVLPGDGRPEAEAALQRFGSYAAVLAASERELRDVPGLGTHSVAAIKLMLEAAVRLARATVSAEPLLDSRDSLYAYLSSVLANERVEQFRILFLDGDGMLVADEVQGTGTVNHTPVYPREVARRAVDFGASAVVLVHNHPSGDPTPSRDDIDMTAAVQAAARVVSVNVRDHIIVGAGRWVSLAEAGLM